MINLFLMKEKREKEKPEAFVKSASPKATINHRISITMLLTLNEETVTLIIICICISVSRPEATLYTLGFLEAFFRVHAAHRQ